MGEKRLYATIDFYDEVYYNRRLLEPRHVQSLVDYLADSGVTRINWVIEQFVRQDRQYPGGFDLLASVVQFARNRSVEVHAVLKPFEGGMGFALPSSFPRPTQANGALLDDIRGPMPGMEPFVAANPGLRFERVPDQPAPSGRIVAIRLVKSDCRATRIGPSHLSIWTSAGNNQFKRYEGPMRFSQSVEHRVTFPTGRDCRLIVLDQLELPPDQRYIQVRCSLADEQGDFSNHQYELVELVSEDGRTEPCTPGCPGLSTRIKDHQQRYGIMTLLYDYFMTPEVRALIDDSRAFGEHYADHCTFDSDMFGQAVNPDKIWTLDREGIVVVARGKARHLPGALHPIYPQVQEHWMSWVRYCIERGVSGVNLRVCNHSDRSHEKSEYGFNAPLLEGCNGRIDRDHVARAAGDAYSSFIARAAQELHKHNRKLLVHVEADMLVPDARGLHHSPMPPNVDWQWERWISEWADGVELRGLFRVRRPEHDFVVDRVSSVCRRFGREMVYQSTIKEVALLLKSQECPRLAWEMQYVRNHPRIDAYMLYETANFSRIDEDGQLRGSPHLKPLLKRFYKLSQ